MKTMVREGGTNPGSLMRWAGFFFSDHGANSLSNVLVRGAVAEEGAEIVVDPSEEAGADLAVGGEANAGA